MKISKFYFVGFLIVLTVFISGCGKKDSKQEQAGDMEKEESYFSEKVADMFKKEKPLECYTEMATPEGSVKAVYYFDNKNEMVRVDMQVIGTSDGINITSSSIIRDGWNYFWDDVMNKDGMKMRIDEDDAGDYSDAEESYSGSFDMNEEFNFRCKQWKVDQSKFALPKDKSFKDLSDMFNNFGGLPAAQGEISPHQFGDNEIWSFDACALCEMIPAGPQREECLRECGNQ